MTRSTICLLTSLAFIALSFLYSFGVLAWVGDQYASNPFNATVLVICYAAIVWALRRVTVTSGIDAFATLLMWGMVLGLGTLAALGWTVYLRSGLAVGTDYPIAVPGSGAAMIFISILVGSYCLAAHDSQNRTFADRLGAFLVLTAFFLGASMALLLGHADSVHTSKVSAQLSEELNSQIESAKRTLQEAKEAQDMHPADAR